VPYWHILTLLNSQSPVREPSVTEVKSELQSILASREFVQSKGLSKLLRYICSKSLMEESEPITEYTIAVDVLGKPHDFKENKDASVRVEVHRLRKRLSDFYQHEGAGHRVRIHIPTGHYSPQFLFAEQEAVVLESESAAVDAPVPTVAPPVIPLELAVSPAPLPVAPQRRNSRRTIAWILAAAALLVALRLAIRPEDSIDRVWSPILTAPGTVLLCIGDRAGGHHPALTHADASQMTLLDYHDLQSQSVLMDDAATLTRFAGLLQSKGKGYRVVSQTEATFADLQGGPAVLIGLANNDWTQQLVGKLRFWVEHKEPGQLILRDRQHPERADWAMDYATPYLDITKDYALVMRVLDPRTGQMVISAAGISAFGTISAGNFLTNADELKKIEAVAPRGWKKMNFELVLSTEVIRGKSGHANIVASHFW